MLHATASPRSPWLRLRQQLYALGAAQTPAARLIARDLLRRLDQLHARYFPTANIVERIDDRLAGLEENADLGLPGANVRLAAITTDIEEILADVERARGEQS
jgi:hypothetical protein